MVKITHINGDEKLVTKGAFESIFKPLGYKMVVNKKKEVKENKEDVTGKKEQSSNDRVQLDDKNEGK